MRKLIIICTVIFFLVGCQTNKENEIINKHNEFTNQDRLDQFIENINEGKKDEIVYTQYGVEGQEGQDTLTYNGKMIEVTKLSDGKFIEKYDCKNLVSEAQENFTKYILKECTDLPADYELAVIPK